MPESILGTEHGGILNKDEISLFLPSYAKDKHEKSNENRLFYDCDRCVSLANIKAISEKQDGFIRKIVEYLDGKIDSLEEQGVDSVTIKQLRALKKRGEQKRDDFEKVQELVFRQNNKD